VTFESDKATVEDMKEALEEGGFPAEGEPEYLE